MRAEGDFAEGERGKFYRPDVEFSLPIYLDTDVDEFLSQLADEKGISVQHLVNELLRATIGLIRNVSAGDATKAA